MLRPVSGSARLRVRSTKLADTRAADDKIDKPPGEDMRMKQPHQTSCHYCKKMTLLQRNLQTNQGLLPSLYFDLFLTCPEYTATFVVLRATDSPLPNFGQCTFACRNRQGPQNCTVQ